MVLTSRFLPFLLSADAGANATTGSAASEAPTTEGADLSIDEDGNPAAPAIVITAESNIIPMVKSTETTGPAPAEEVKAYRNPRDRFPVVREEKILLKSIRFDDDLQSRVKIDDATVEEYGDIILERVKRGEEPGFPAVDIFESPDGKTRWMVGGFHRGHGHHRAKVKEILSNIRIGTKQDALLFAATENTTHGLKRTQKDKQKALKIVLNHPDAKEWSNVEIAKAAGVSEAMVRDHRSVAQSSSVRTVKKGDKTVKMDVSRIGSKGGKAAKSSSKKSNGTGKAPAAPGEKPVDGDGSLPATNAEGKPQLAFSEVGEAAFKKVIRALGDHGSGFEEAVRTNVLPLTQKDVITFSESSPERIRRVYPLIAGGMKPGAAYAFIDEEITEKTTVAQLENFAIAGKTALTLPDLNKLKTDGATGIYEKRGNVHIIVIRGKAGK